MNKKNIYFTIITLFLLISNINSNELFIRRIVFEGNASFSNRELQNVIISRENAPVNRSIVNDDAQRIYNLYFQRGYNLFKISTPSIIPVSNRNVDVIFHIEEFTEPIIERIVFRGNSYFSESKIFELTGRNINEKHDFDSLDGFIRQITELYLSFGFLFVSIQLLDILPVTKPNINVDQDIILEEKEVILEATINIIEGSIVRAENFVFRGNSVTRDNILIVESRIQQGEIITPEVLNLAERRLSSKQYIQSSHILPVNENTILIEITEGKMTHLSAVMGYSTSEERKNSFNGFINGDFMNLMGTDRNFSFAWRSFEGIFTSVLLEYHESGPVNVPVAGDLRFYREERDSTSVRTETEVDIYLQYRTQKYGILGGQNELYPGSRRPKLLERQTDRVIGFFWEGDFTDDFINPREGWSMRYEQRYLFVKRSEDKLQRHRFESSISNYTALSRSWVLSNTFTGKYLENNSLTEFDLIRLGGAFSLRGFYEDFFSGNLIFYTNTEFRYLMSRYSRVFFFIDYGYIEDNRGEMQNRFNDLLGIGLGLRAETRIGLLRIDYGFHHANGQWLNPLNGIIHFGIEARF